MKMRGVIEYRGDPAVMAREMKKVVSGALETLGIQWHRETLPRHFTHAGARDYFYQPRDVKYLKYKGWKFGHQDPLVFRGNLRNQALRRADIRSSGKAVKVVITGPRYLYMYRKDYRQPDKADEITRTTNAEIRSMADRLGELVVAGLEQRKTVRTERVG